MHTSSQSAIAESFRGLRASVEHVRSRDEINTFVITAMAPRQGASLVAANLALAIADTATTVVVVDANLQSPNQAEIFDVDAGPGLTDLLTTKIGLDEVVAAGPSENIWVVPIGSRRAKSADLLATPRMRALITELQGRFDVVIIDTPAISTATDATVLGSFGAATLLVVAEGTATRPGLSEALNALAAGGSVPAGVVLNQIPRSTRSLRPEAPAAARTSRRVTGTKTKAPAPVVAPVIVEAVEAPVVAAPAVPVTPVVPAAPAVPPASAEPVPVERVKVPDTVLEITPPVVESTSTRAAARAARVAAKAAARAAASRPQQPVSRFAPKPPDAVETAEAAAAAARRARSAPIIDSVPVLEPVDESSNPVIDVPRGDTGERVTLLAPQPGDPTPEELAEIVANQFKDDVVYEIPAETFGSFHLVDAEAFAAIDNEPTILPPFRSTESEAVAQPLAPLTEENAAFVIDLLADEPVYDQPRFEDWAIAAQSDPALAEDSGRPLGFVESGDAHDDTEPEFDASVYDRAAPAAVEPPVYDAPVYDAPVYEVPVYEVPLVDAPVADAAEEIEPAVYEVPLVEVAAPAPAEPEAAEPASAEPAVAEPAAPAAAVAEPASAEPTADVTAPRPVFVAPATWPAPRLVADWTPAEQPAAAAAQPEPEPALAEAPAPELARVTALPTAVSRERLARESYLLKSRELERAAQERLRYEQERLEARIREQLEADRRQLAGKLDELLEDTVMMPRSVGDGS
jgi:capsular exopolysaccharide synthesis family protein